MSNADTAFRTTLRKGVRCLRREAAGKMSKTIKGFRSRSDGGFTGRSGNISDVYYTLFGCSCLQALGHTLYLLKLKKYIGGIPEQKDFVHQASRYRLRKAFGLATNDPEQELSPWKSLDGGFHHQRKNSTTGSLYGLYLGVLCGMPRKAAAGLTEQFRDPDGGYLNTLEAVEPTVTATSAALNITEKQSSRDIEWLLGCRMPDGGFKAHPSAPEADLLSTAVALFALRNTGAFTETERNDTFRYIQNLWHPSGGFTAHRADTACDTEYAYYGLLALGSCHEV